MIAGAFLKRVSLATLVLGLVWSSARAAAPVDAADMALGNPKAPVTVIEYASLGCPHCGVWARDVFPTFKKKYVDSGKARFVLREVLFGDPALAAAGFLTARCAGRAKYFQVVEAIFDAQPKIAAEGDALPSLLEAAKGAGLTEPQFSACKRDTVAVSVLQARSDGYVANDKITGTPTFFVGSEKLEGAQTLANLDAAIVRATPKPPVPAREKAR